MDIKQWKYKIGSGKVPVVLSLGMVLLFGSLSIWLHKNQNGAYLFCDIFTILMAAVLVVSLFHYFFFPIRIEEKGFYYQTNPFNGAYFAYQDIARCWEVLKIYRYYRSPDRSYHYYFYFTDRRGKTRRFLFSREIYEKEIAVLKERIERQNGT